MTTTTAEDTAAASDRAETSSFASRNLWVIVGLVVLIGACVRLVNIGDPMFDFHPTRQYISVDLAWKYDMAMGGPSTPEDREAATIRSEFEPPVMEPLITSSST